MSRVAAIDCGTNSIRLLIADIDSDTGAVREITRRMEVVRLGQGVDRTGYLDPLALERTLAMAEVYAEAIQEAKVTAVRCVATSATRDAANRDQLVAGFQRILGVEPEVISGAEEAALSFRGATSGMAAEHQAPYLVVDLGGGSTELVLGDTGVQAAVSINIGCVRMTERHIHHDPPTSAELATATRDIDAAIVQAFDQIPVEQVRTMIGVAGSVTTVTAHALGLAEYRRDLINGAVLPITDVQAACRELTTLDRADRTALGFMHPGRVDVIAAGALVWSRVMNLVSQRVRDAGFSLDHVVTSESDILDGIALSLVR